jgi:glycosyltransferase involved in cell wall biosynthesis
MRLLFVVDGRSPIAINWISYFIERGDEVHIVSTFDCQPHPGLQSFTYIPVAFSDLKSRVVRGSNNHTRKSRLWSSSWINFRTWLRRFAAPFTVSKAADKLRERISEIQPEIVHAMRIPYEGILAAQALSTRQDQVLLISVWGNDFTLHAPATPWMSRYTNQVLCRANALHTDCFRDQKLAYEWGFKRSSPAIIIPGNGGVKLDIFYPPDGDVKERSLHVINPRGFRAYIRNDTFFASIPKVSNEFSRLKVLCPGMASRREAEKWIKKLGLSQSVQLLPQVNNSEMAELFRRSSVSVSPSTHDGTPNTLLEAMACGCFPIAGDIESLHEWIEPGVNGMFFDPSNPASLADVLISALHNPQLLRNAAEVNYSIIRTRAEFKAGMQKANDFYNSIIN